MPRDPLNSPTPEEIAAFDASIETQGFARVFVPISFLVQPNDILHRNERRYRVVEIREHRRAQEVIFEPILGEADITFPRDVSASFDVPLSPEVREFYRQAFGYGDDRTLLIRAEVEAMDWPEVIGE